jgi:hypothetical protein
LLFSRATLGKRNGPSKSSKAAAGLPRSIGYVKIRTGQVCNGYPPRAVRGFMASAGTCGSLTMRAEAPGPTYFPARLRTVVGSCQTRQRPMTYFDERSACAYKAGACFRASRPQDGLPAQPFAEDSVAVSACSYICSVHLPTCNPTRCRPRRPRETLVARARQCLKVEGGAPATL